MQDGVTGRETDAFYKFMSFGPHARLSLFMLFKHQAIFFSHRSVLNDPTDCTPHLYNDLDESDAADQIRSILKNDRTLSEADKKAAEDTLTRYKEAPRSKRDKRFAGVYLGGLLGNFFDSPTEFINSYMRKKISDAKIFSMSKTWKEPRMWAHYASSHSGFCLQVSGLGQQEDGIIFDRVDYTTRRPSISATEICAAATRKNAALTREIFSRSYLQKSVGWLYEEEYRLILPADIQMKDRLVLNLPEGFIFTFLA
jgi:hypothetical protein